MSSYDKVAKLSCKPEAAPQKSKYTDSIIAATCSEDGAIQDVCKTLSPCIREPNTINKEAAERVPKSTANGKSNAVSAISPNHPSLPTLLEVPTSQEVATSSQQGAKDIIEFFSAIEEEQSTTFNPQNSTTGYVQPGTNPFAQMANGPNYQQPQVALQPTGSIVPQETAVPQQSDLFGNFLGKQVQQQSTHLSQPTGFQQLRPPQMLSFPQSPQQTFLQQPTGKNNPFRRSIFVPQSTGMAVFGASQGQSTPNENQSSQDAPASLPGIPASSSPSSTIPLPALTPSMGASSNNTPAHPSSTPLTSYKAPSQPLQLVKSHQTGAKNPFSPIATTLSPVPKATSLLELTIGMTPAGNVSQSPQSAEQALPLPQQTGAFNKFSFNDSTLNPGAADMSSVASSFTFIPNALGSTISEKSSSNDSEFMGSQQTGTTTTGLAFSDSSLSQFTTSLSIPPVTSHVTGFGGLKPFIPSSSFGISLMESLPFPGSSPINPTSSSNAVNGLATSPGANHLSLSSNGTGNYSFLNDQLTGATGGSGGASSMYKSSLGVGLRPRITEGGAGNPFRPSSLGDIIEIEPSAELNLYPATHKSREKGKGNATPYRLELASSIIELTNSESEDDEGKASTTPNLNSYPTGSLGNIFTPLLQNGMLASGSGSGFETETSPIRLKLNGHNQVPPPLLSGDEEHESQALDTDHIGRIEVSVISTPVIEREPTMLTHKAQSQVPTRPTASDSDLTPIENMDPISTAVTRILEIIPDVEPTHLLELIKTHLSTYSVFHGNHDPDADDEEGAAAGERESTVEEQVQGVVGHMLHLLFENPDYPKADLQAAGKRKEETMGESDDPLQIHKSLHTPTNPSVLAVEKSFERERRPYAIKFSRTTLKKLQGDLAMVEKADVINKNVVIDVSDDEDNGTGIECQCCFAEYPFSEMVQCPEAHLFCSTCISTYASAQLGTHNPSLTCIHPSSCSLPFPTSELKRSLSVKLYELYERLQQQKEIRQAGLVGLEECPFCEWKCVVEASIKELKLFICGNEEGGCGVVSCRLCRKLDHSPKSCKEVREDKKLDRRHVIEEAMSRALIRNCPKCQKPFVKERGCNKMSCPNCHTTSCYICRQVITSYDHFTSNQKPRRRSTSDAKECILYDEVEDRHAQEVKEAAKKAKERYRHDH